MTECRVRGCREKAGRLDFLEDNNHNQVSLCRVHLAAVEERPEDFYTVFGREVIEVPMGRQAS